MEPFEKQLESFLVSCVIDGCSLAFNKLSENGLESLLNMGCHTDGDVLEDAVEAWDTGHLDDQCLREITDSIIKNRQRKRDNNIKRIN